MPGENCLVCASDDGIFLDVVKQPTLRAKAKNCRLEKVSEDGLSTKVCYKCAFEIEQCNTFVDKIKKANKIQITRRGCCVLCLDAYNKEIFFDLSKEKIGINNLIQKTRDLFPDELKYIELQKQLICLSCRYCVDLLTDLRNLSDEIPTKLKTIIQNGIDPADLPKTRTSIVNRKTTFIQSSNLDLNTPSDTDSDCSSIMSNRKRVNKVNKTLIVKSQRKCEQCKIEVKSGVDMYKIYRTGVTVCKQCWLTIDPGKTKIPSKKRKKIDYSETKLCSVLLEDVYQKDPNEREYKIEKDNKGNTVFIITDDSESESRSKRKVIKTKANDIENKQDEVKESLQDLEMKKSKPTKGGRKKDEIEKSIQETVETISTRSGNRRKESEQSIQGDTEVKSAKNRRRKESEQSVLEEVETKSNRSSRKKESEESIQEADSKSPRNRRIRKDSEQSIQENADIKATRIIRKRKESEESSQEDIEVQFTRSTRNRKDSEQSIQEIIESKSTKSTRFRKESEPSSQESESKSTKSNKNRRDSERSSQESIIIINTRELRRRYESEQSAQEDIEVNVDVDSDSAPVFKKAKRSSAKVESMPKPVQSKVSNQNTIAESEVLFTRKRGRSSSRESTGSIRRSTRNAKKHAQELEEIIEIDDDSNSFKTQKENVSINEDVIMNESKRSRRDRLILYDEHSDTESNASDIKVGSKRSSSVSSKESTPVSKFKAPPNKDNHESVNLESLKFTSKELKSNKFIKIRKSEIGKFDDVESLKSIEIDTSESEEIDVLKSTDEETKDDTVEIESEEKDNSTLLTLKESICKPVADDDKDTTESVDDEITASLDEENLKSTEENIDLTSDTSKENESEMIEKSSKLIIKESENSEIEESTKLHIKETNKLKRRRDSMLVKENVLESVTQECPQTLDKESIEEGVVKADIDTKKDTVAEIMSDIEKEVIVADVNDGEVNLSEDNSDSVSDTLKEKFTSNKRLSMNISNSRKSKSFSSRKFKKTRTKYSADNIFVYDFSDSETMKTVNQTELTYTCTICDKIYGNKFIGLQHELTHMKTLEIKLQKVELPDKNKSFNESDIELEISSKEDTFHSNIIDESMAVDNNGDKSEESRENQEQVSEKENDENKLVLNEKEEAFNDNEKKTKNSNLRNVNIDTSQVIKDKEIHNKLNKIQENIEENGEVMVNNSLEEKVEYIETKRENEIEITNRRSTRRLSNKIEIKCDRKSRGKRKTVNDNAELEEEVKILVESASDKIAEAVQETLNDMAELHGKIQESTPEKVPELNRTTKTAECEMGNKMENTKLKIVVENRNDISVALPFEKEECTVIFKSNAFQTETLRSEEEAKCPIDKEKQQIGDNDLMSPIVDAKDDSPKEIIAIGSEIDKLTNESAAKLTKIDDTEAESIKSITNVDYQEIDFSENNECKLSKANNVLEVEEIVDSSAGVLEHKSTIDSVTEINVESVTEANIATADKPSIDSNDNNPVNEAVNDVLEINNEDDDNNTEDEEALAQESLEELLQRKGLQIIDEFAESVTDGDEESEKDANISSEKENAPDKEIELHNELQIKISDSECTEILEISSKSKQKEVEHSVVGESQIIQDVDVVEEVINDDDQPQDDVVQEVEVESNGNCVNVANNVVGQVLTEVFNMATVDLTKRLELQTEPISDEETEMIPETLENISREIRNSQDMPSLDPIGDVIDD